MEYEITKPIDMNGLTEYLINIKGVALLAFTMTSSQVHKLSNLDGNESCVLANADSFAKEEYIEMIYDMFFHLCKELEMVDEDIDKIYRDLIIKFEWLWYEDVEKPISKRKFGRKKKGE